MNQKELQAEIEELIEDIAHCLIVDNNRAIDAWVMRRPTSQLSSIKRAVQNGLDKFTILQEKCNWPNEAKEKLEYTISKINEAIQREYN